MQRKNMKYSIKIILFYLCTHAHGMHAVFNVPEREGFESTTAREQWERKANVDNAWITAQAEKQENNPANDNATFTGQDEAREHRPTTSNTQFTGYDEEQERREKVNNARVTGQEEHNTIAGTERNAALTSHAQEKSRFENNASATEKAEREARMP
jgi:hypothetical protein